MRMSVVRKVGKYMRETTHEGAKVYIYTRVSTAMQVDGYSLDAQRDEIMRYVQYKNMHVCGEYTDEGKSGKNIHSLNLDIG